MEPVARNPEALIEAFRPFTGRVLHLHLETTAGAYTAGGFGAFARNLPVHIERLSLRGAGPFRIGAETGEGFIYAEGITQHEPRARLGGTRRARTGLVFGSSYDRTPPAGRVKGITCNRSRCPVRSF